MSCCVVCGDYLPEGHGHVCEACAAGSKHYRRKEDKYMNANEYQTAAMRTASGQSSEDLILNGVLGLNGEAGEVADIIKKARFQGHDMDHKKISEELGDVCWYIAIMAEGLGISLSEIMYHNIKKLERRYPAGFDADRSLHRDE